MTTLSTDNTQHLLNTILKLINLQIFQEDSTAVLGSDKPQKYRECVHFFIPDTDSFEKFINYLDEAVVTNFEA